MTDFNTLIAKVASLLEQNNPFVIYKKANTKLVQLVFQDDAELHTVQDFNEQGFVFAPFDAKDSPVLIPSHNTLTASFEGIEFEGHSNNGYVFSEKSQAKELHMDLVAKTVAQINISEVSKIVVAREKELAVAAVDVIALFQKLIFTYNNATCYLWFHPNVGTWLGATPETLIKTQGNRFETMSLAGTQQNKDSATTIWGTKEIEEQKLVTDYVLENLAKVSTSLEKSKTYTVKAGSLLHLRTDIAGEIKAGKSIKDLIAVLHPTPAVCGFPREASKEFILANEHFERSFYTGYLGELNMNNSCSLYVNLRCMEQLSPTKIKLYIGGGITAKSNPAKEWEETVAKCKTMESIL